MPDEERQELIAHLECLPAILRTTKDMVQRAGLEKVIIYLGNRLATLIESDAA